MHTRITFLIVLATTPAATAQQVAHGYDALLFGEPVVEASNLWGQVLPAAGDVDEDGQDDVLATPQAAGELALFLGQASGGLGPAVPVTMPPAVAFLPQPFLADVNGDAHLDVLAHDSFTGALAMRPGAGDGTFGPAVATSTLPAQSLHLTFADVDQDGDVDVAFETGGLLPHDVQWMEGAGDGTFAGLHVVDQVAQAAGLVAADLDEDGVLDLAALDGQQVAVWLGLGGGAFAPPTHHSSFAAKMLLAADMDRDGALDVVHAGMLDAVTILHGLGGGGLGEPLFVGLGATISAFAAPDLELDGYPDLLGSAITVPPSTAAVRMDRNGPIGGPVAFPLPAVAAGNRRVTGDFDGDGLQDFVATDFFGSELISVTNALGPIVDLGFAVTSAQGTAQLQAFGTPQPGSIVSVQEIAPAFPAPGLLVIGLQAQDVPFLGSTFVPSPDLVLLLDVSSTQFTGFWPPGFPAGVPVYLQAVHALAGGGKTISNAVMILSQ